jgi:hypothetical protein
MCALPSCRTLKLPSPFSVHHHLSPPELTRATLPCYTRETKEENGEGRDRERLMVLLVVLLLPQRRPALMAVT